MRLLLTADLHYNHARSRPLAEELIARINRESFDILVLVGDTAPAESEELAGCLGAFAFTGPRLFVPGNHELWTRGADSHHLYATALPQRIADLGWRWLPGNPYVVGAG